MTSCMFTNSSPARTFHFLARAAPIADPGNVVLLPVLSPAGPVEPDQRPQCLSGWSWSDLGRRFEMRDDSRDLLAVAAANAVRLLDKPAVALDQPRVERELLV